MRPRQSAGSGVIVDAGNGYVLTNHHVIEGAEAITVTLKDRRSFEARLIGSDPGTDIALLQIEAENLTELPLGDSDRLAVRDLLPVGEDVEVTVLRDGERRTVRARIRKAEAQRVSGGESRDALRGAVFETIGEDHPLHGKVHGAVVAAVEPGSPAARNGLRPGDVIVAVNRHPVRSAGEFERAVANAGRVLALDVVRGTARLFLVIR